MAKPDTKEPKVELEREYIVPLRKEWLKVPKYKRANKAVKGLKEFIAQHMKIYDRDLRKVKIDILVNNEIRFRGMKKPLSKIKVKAIKLDNGTVRVELVDLPPHIKFAKLRDEKKKAEVEKKVKEKEAVNEANSESKKKDAKAGSESKDAEKKKDAKEKREASKDESEKISKKQALTEKHTSKEKPISTPRKTLSR